MPPRSAVVWLDLKYDPNQPRDPAGTSTGGQWSSGESGQPTASTPSSQALAKKLLDESIPEDLQEIRTEIGDPEVFLGPSARLSGNEFYDKIAYYMEDEGSIYNIGVYRDRTAILAHEWGHHLDRKLADLQNLPQDHWSERYVVKEAWLEDSNKALSAIESGAVSSRFATLTTDDALWDNFDKSATKYGYPDLASNLKSRGGVSLNDKNLILSSLHTGDPTGLYAVAGKWRNTGPESGRSSKYVDFVGALTTNRIGFGHPTSYFSTVERRTSEMFANAIATYSDPVFNDFMRATSPKFHSEFTKLIKSLGKRRKKSLSVSVKYDPNQPRDPEGSSTGGQWVSTGASPSVEGIKLEPSKDRAFEGEQVETENKLTKRQTGQVGEAAVIAYLKSKGFDDAKLLNMEQENFPVDLVQDHELIEVKSGLVSNVKDSQKWRATIGQPGPTERAWLKTASAEDKRAWNYEKSRAILNRKNQVLEDFAKATGSPARGKTITTIVNPDTKTVDIYEFDGFHLLIRWNSDTARNGYRGSFKYD